MSTPTQAEISATAGGPLARDSIQMTLNHDHDRLDRLFRSIIYAMDSTDPTDLRSAWMAFEGELERHLDTEDREIVPLFARSRPGEARVLKEEHRQIRARLLDLGVDLDLHCLTEIAYAPLPTLCAPTRDMRTRFFTPGPVGTSGRRRWRR